MKKSVLYLIILTGILLFAVITIKYRSTIYRFLEKPKTNSIEKNISNPVLAEFSFQSDATNIIFKTFPHFTIKLCNTKNWKIKREVVTQIADSIPLMITVETWSRNILTSYTSNPIEDMVNGKYNTVIKELCTNIIGTRPNVYVRFNPEMEVPVNRYPWQYIGGHTYIEAFRHFSELCKTFSPQVKQIWGPAGYPGIMEWYPGDEVVDAVSVTIKSNSEMPLEAYPKNYSIEYDLFRRLHRLRFINKPVFILGSNQAANDSINDSLISSYVKQVNNERNIIYSEDNFLRPKLNARVNRNEKIEIGLYDPQSLLNSEGPVSVEHLFADFGNLQNGTFQSSFEEVLERKHDVIVTFEPFRNPNGETDLHVLQNVSMGQYDKEIAQLYNIIKSTQRMIYLRYAHEMEIPITRYPWQSQNPIDYIKSFRYFMTFQDSLPANVKRVWGPAGDRGSIEWWPGNDVVDFVSIAIYGLPDKNITDPEKQESFSTIFNRKYQRLRILDKPIFITEFGVKGPEKYQTEWLAAAAKVIRKNPQIVGINYFNMSDTPKAWGEIKPPDWSITKESFYSFINILNESD